VQEAIYKLYSNMQKFMKWFHPLWWNWSSDRFFLTYCDWNYWNRKYV